MSPNIYLDCLKRHEEHPHKIYFTYYFRSLNKIGPLVRTIPVTSFLLLLTGSITVSQRRFVPAEGIRMYEYENNYVSVNGVKKLFTL